MCSWDNRMGVNVDAKYPENVLEGLTDDDILTLFTTHALGGEPGILSMTMKRINVVSYYTGKPKDETESQFIVALFLTESDEPKKYEEYLSAISSNLIKSIDKEGFMDFFVSGWTGAGRFPREVPLNVYGPSNTMSVIGKMMDSLSWDIQLRIEQAKNDPRGGQVNYFEREEGVVYDQEGITVTAFPVDHGIVKPALGYKFQYNGKTIVISGDTRPCENIVIQARDADVLVHEAYSKAWTDVALKRLPGENPEKTKAAVESVMQYHSSTVEAARIAHEAGAKHLVFTHLLPPPSPVWYFEKMWVKGVYDIYGGKITVGRDLMEF